MFNQQIIFMNRRTFTLVVFFISFVMSAQEFQRQWTGHFSYANIKDIFRSENNLFVAAENAVFKYNLASQAIETYTTIDGLSGESISVIHYSELNDIILVGYKNGLINIIRKEDNRTNVKQVVDIVEKQTIAPDKKTINHFYEYNSQLYISTDFGITVFDLNRLEFGDTYFIGQGGSESRITQTTVSDSYIYATSPEWGIRRAKIDDSNLIDYTNWELVTTGNFQAIEKLGNELYVASSNNSVSRLDTNGALFPVRNFQSPIKQFRNQDGALIITTTSGIHAYANGFNLIQELTYLNGHSFELDSGIVFDNNFYLGTLEEGLLIVPFGSQAATQILPNGPIRNRPFGLDATAGQLWVVFGETTINFNPFPLRKYGVSQLKDSVWNNISYEALSQAVGGKEPTNLMKVTINPKNPEEVYMSSFQKGLLKLENGIPTILYDETNSPLERINIGADAGIRIFGSAFDREGNLWFVQSRTGKGLIRLSPEGQFRKVDLSNFMSNPADELALTKLVITREGYVFFGAYTNGLFGYDPNTQIINKIGENQGNGNLPSANVRALAVDMQNRLWIGTLRGLRLLHSPAGFFDGGLRDSQPIIIMENGVAQELLYQQSITAIEIDGSNNKWIATASSGVFYVSPNGQETLLRFTKDNSPLPSNNVQDIAIDPNTGMVYFATTQGLVAYKGTATAPRNTLERLRAFPNPVRPGYQGFVTIDGLTSQANVKITDVSGNLVYETTSQGGSIQWDTTAFGKYKVRSGVYFIMVTTEDDQETKVAKVMIIR